MPPNVKAPNLDNEDFLIWLEHPITRAMMGKLEDIEKKAKEAWLAASWCSNLKEIQEGFPQLLLVELRTRAELARSMREMKYGSIAKFKDAKNVKQ
jgi:hypothetical protein